MSTKPPPLPLLRWTRSSNWVLSAFLATLALIAVVWWPMVEDYLSWIDPRRPLWTQLDWLLLGIFAFMTVLITAGADLRQDARVAAVGLVGGLIIESWGTQTGLWSYFTQERPPLWILPAWPVASLTIDRIARALDRLLPPAPRAFAVHHAAVFLGFLVLLLDFSWPSPAADADGVGALFPAHALARRSASGDPDLRRGRWSRLLPRIVGDDAPVLDVPYAGDAAALRRPGARHGGGCVLARRDTHPARDGPARRFAPPSPEWI